MTGQQAENILKLALLALAVVGFVGCLSGCMDPATRAQIAQVKNQAAIDAAKSKAAADAAAAKAKAAADAVVEEAKTNPIRHPIAFANLIVSEIRPWLVSIGLFCTIFTFVGIGMLVAASAAAAVPGIIGLIAKIAGGIAKFATPVLFTTGLGCWVTLWIAPLFFLFMAVVFIGGIVWIIVYLKKHDWKIKTQDWKITTLFAKHEENANAIKQATGVDPKLLAAGITDVKSPAVVGQ